MDDRLSSKALPELLHPPVLTFADSRPPQEWILRSLSPPRKNGMGCRLNDEPNIPGMKLTYLQAHPILPRVNISSVLNRPSKPVTANSTGQRLGKMAIASLLSPADTRGSKFADGRNIRTSSLQTIPETRSGTPHQAVFSGDKRRNTECENGGRTPEDFRAMSSKSAQPPPITEKFRSLAAIDHAAVLNYKLRLRQHPIAARACGFGDRDRRTVDPPPVVELRITDQATGAPASYSESRLALHCTLIGAESDTEAAVQPIGPVDCPASARPLIGTLVASPFEGADDNGTPGTFFVFGDLSCRTGGKYRLHFRLLRIDPLRMKLGARHDCVVSISSDVFTVCTAKDFPGMQRSSKLLVTLRAQGLNVCIKKGSSGRKRRRSVSSSDTERSEAEMPAGLTDCVPSSPVDGSMFAVKRRPKRACRR